MKSCPFDEVEKEIGNRLVHRVTDQNNGWYAFVPLEPEIFGHVIVTVEKPCIREIITDTNEIVPVLQRMSKGVEFMAKVLSCIENVQRVYIAMLGESEDVHMHYHLFPRYNFVGEFEINTWAERNRLKEGSIEWQRFYSRPTAGFQLSSGFQYLGEIEKSYNEATKRIGNKPSNEVLEEIKRRLKGLIKEESKNKGD